MQDKNSCSWKEIIEALKYTHTLSVRDICKQMKASRSWVNKYILPHIDSIYLNSNIRNDSKTKGKLNWVLMASIQLNKEEYMKDSVWCSESDFTKLIKSNIISITKQTKYIPIELLVVDPLQYSSIYNEYSEKINEVKDNLEDKKT